VKELNEAKVLAVGPGGLNKDGQRIAPSVAPGDKVLIPQVGVCQPGEENGQYQSTDLGAYSMAGAL
jgi:co-chaperonin GroES (HSP10)